MSENIFGKTIGIIFSLLVLTELISLIGHFYQPLNLVGFFIIIVFTFAASLRKLAYGIYILLAELCIGGKGYLFSLELNDITISIRMALFLTLFLIWLGWKIKNRKFQLNLNKKFILPYGLLGLTIIYGIINGLRLNQTNNVIFDSNAWIFFTLIFILIDTITDQKIIDNIIKIIIAATSLIAIKTLIVLVFFSHNLATVGDLFYKWLRDTGVGEITYISGTLFRVFFQSQIYVLIGLFIALMLILLAKKNHPKQNIFLLTYIYLMSLTLIISQSRSFWLGALTALTLAIGYLWFQSPKPLKKTFILVLITIITISSQILLIQIITNNFSANPISDRFKNLTSDAAGNSRLNQLQPLTYNIGQQFIFGYGFGKELTYQSTDPRILAANPGGIYTTYAFEWGYLDITLKLGLIGLTTYLFLIYTIFQVGLKNHTPASIGLLTALTAVLVTNIFSPYLNHPLGIGYLILISAIFNYQDQIKQKNSEKLYPNH